MTQSRPVITPRIHHDGECGVGSNPDLMRDILSEWAKIQKKSIKVTKSLEKGLPVMNTAWIPEQVEKMVGDPEWFEAQRKVMEEEGEGPYSHREYKE